MENKEIEDRKTIRCKDSQNGNGKRGIGKKIKDKRTENSKIRYKERQNGNEKRGIGRENGTERQNVRKQKIERR